MTISRREFLKRGALASAFVVVPGFLAACARSGAALAPAPGDAAFKNTYFAHSFGITEETLRTVMARAMARGGDFCDIFFEHSVTNQVRLEDGAVNLAKSTVDLGAGIRVVQGNRFGYAFTEELTLESMLKAADTASAIASSAPRLDFPTYAIKKTPEFYPIAMIWEEVGIDKKMPWLEKVNTLVLKRDARVIRSTVNFSDTTKRVMVATSDGMVVEDFQPMTTMSASCTAEQKGRKESGYFNLASRGDLNYYTEERLTLLANEAVDRTVRLFEAVQPPSGEMPLVMGPGPSGILLHEAIGHGIEADFNRKNVSIFSDKLGKKIAIPEVTIIDSGIHKNVRGSINVDDEGNIGQETILVENGVLTSYLHDRISAAHYKVAPTGSGRRESFRFAPMPRMRNTYMAAGPESPEEILRSVKKGIYAESFRNGQVRIGEGSFSFYIATGYMIEDGKLTAPIKDVNIIGSGPEVLSRITKVGNDPTMDIGGWTCGKNGQMVPVGQGMTTTLVSSITIGGTKA